MVILEPPCNSHVYSCTTFSRPRTRYKAPWSGESYNQQNTKISSINSGGWIYFDTNPSYFLHKNHLDLGPKYLKWIIFWTAYKQTNKSLRKQTNKITNNGKTEGLYIRKTETYSYYCKYKNKTTVLVLTITQGLHHLPAPPAEWKRNCSCTPQGMVPRASPCDRFLNDK